MHLFHPDAIIGSTDLDNCILCRQNIAQIVKSVTTERNLQMFFCRHDCTGRIIANFSDIAKQFGLSTATVRATVRSVWRKVQGYHMNKCRRQRLLAMRIGTE